MSEKTMYMPYLKNTSLLKNVNHHLTTQGCPKPSIYKKQNKVKHNKKRYVCI